MKDYYKILGVHPSAHAADIKRAYRKLALLYHPDKNPDPTAERYIKEINEAYDVLSDPEARQAYDLRRTNPLHDILQHTQTTHRDPAYRGQSPNRPKRKSENEKMFELMVEYHAHAKWMVIVAFAFCIVLCLDLLIPFKQTTDRIVDIRHSKQVMTRGRYGESITTNIIVFDHSSRVKISAVDGDNFNIGDYVQINSSAFFGITRSIVGKNAYVAEAPVSIYGTFFFAPIVLLLISAVGLGVRKRIELTFNLGVACFFVLILNVVFILMS